MADRYEEDDIQEIDGNLPINRLDGLPKNVREIYLESVERLIDQNSRTLKRMKLRRQQAIVALQIVNIQFQKEIGTFPMDAIFSALSDKMATDITIATNKCERIETYYGRLKYRHLEELGEIWTRNITKINVLAQTSLR